MTYERCGRRGRCGFRRRAGGHMRRGGMGLKLRRRAASGRTTLVRAWRDDGCQHRRLGTCRGRRRRVERTGRSSSVQCAVESLRRSRMGCISRSWGVAVAGSAWTRHSGAGTRCMGPTMGWRFLTVGQGAVGGWTPSTSGGAAVAESAQTMGGAAVAESTQTMGGAAGSASRLTGSYVAIGARRAPTTWGVAPAWRRWDRTCNTRRARVGCRAGRRVECLGGCRSSA